MKPGSKIYKLFEQLTDNLDEVMTGFEHPSGVLKYGYEDFVKIRDARRRYDHLRMARSLEAQEYIKQFKKGQKILYKLTEEGWKEKLKHRILNKQKRLKNGQVCIVSFDIPERSRAVRTSLRFLLAEADFRQVHRSVWEGDRDVIKELRDLVKALRAEEWIRIYSGKKVI